MRQQMATAARALVALMMAGGLAGCGGPDSSLSGRYVAELEGSTMEFNFLGDGKATFAMTEDGEGEPVDCAYEAGENLIAVSCFGSSGISLTRVDGGLEADMGGVIVRYKKR
ncbi:MAG: hypothetical protein JNK40_12360 [Chromatiales bacterium]|nr:hypothetical protein [Chromatiales bacterium]